MPFNQLVDYYICLLSHLANHQILLYRSFGYNSSIIMYSISRHCHIAMFRFKFIDILSMYKTKLIHVFHRYFVILHLTIGGLIRYSKLVNGYRPVNQAPELGTF